MISFTAAIASVSSSARSAPKRRSALSSLLPQSSGNKCVTALGKAKILIRSLGQHRGIPRPGGGDQDEGTNESDTLEGAVPGDFGDPDSLAVNRSVRRVTA